MLQKVLIWLELPFFALRLALSVLPSLVRVAYPENLRLVPLVPAVLFLVVILGQYQLSKAQQPSSVDQDNGLQAQVSSVLEKEIEFWLSWYQVQPTHRDVLLNLHYLYQQLGDEDKALLYLKQAQTVDPNSPLVQQP